MRSEAIEYNGITFRRYPDAKWWSDRSYYVPGGQHRKRGVGRLHEEVWKAHHGKIPDGCQIHHKDGNTLNNEIGNLECLTRQQHEALHRERSSTRSLHPKALAHLAAIRPKAAGWHSSEEGRAWHSENGKRVWASVEPTEHICQRCGSTYASRAMHNESRFCSNKCRVAARRASGVDDESRACEQCGAPFVVNRYAKKRYCSKSCDWDARRAKR